MQKDDLISRQALCEYALNQKDKSVTPNDIMRFPSAQPEVIRCKDCKFADWDLDGEGGYCNKMDVNDPFYVDYDFFCAKAERKKNETD